MKKADIISLIKNYADSNDVGFKTTAYKIAHDFSANGDEELAEYIASILSSQDVFVPQIYDGKFAFLHKAELREEPLLLPDAIKNDFARILQIISNAGGINKFLFKGGPGTGKTAAAKCLARLSKRDLFVVSSEEIIDSKLGQTSKNLVKVFQELQEYDRKDKIMVLFDEIDAIALNRIDNHDLREMGRVTSTLLRCLDEMDDRIILLATTNLADNLDRALIRRFDFVVDFDRYNEQDLIEIADVFLSRFQDKYGGNRKDIRLFNKVLAFAKVKISPGELMNIIKIAVAFSATGGKDNFYTKIYEDVSREQFDFDVNQLKKAGFTTREIGMLLSVSSSQVSRKLAHV